MSTKSELVPKKVERKDGVITTVYVKPKDTKTKIKTAVAAAPPPSAVTKPSEEQETATEVKAKPTLAFSPDKEWGMTHLNRRNFRIINGLGSAMSTDSQRRVIRAMESKGTAESQDYVKAMGTSLAKWKAISSLTDDEISLDIPENIYQSSNKRYDLMTEMAENKKVQQIIADDINENKSEDDPDVELEDIKLSFELMRDSTSDRDTAIQSRAYAIRTRRQDILHEIAERQQQVSALEAPLRDLVDPEYTSSEYTYELGGDDGDAYIRFTPRTTLDEDRALKELSKDERKQLQTKVYDWSKLPGVVGDKRAQSLRKPMTTATYIR